VGDPLGSGEAEAFAPAVISNFYRAHDSELARSRPDLSKVGATGGGFTLSRGVFTRVTLRTASKPKIHVTMNGDPRYKARTTSKAVELLLGSLGIAKSVEIRQRVEVPIGCGFGSSSASALSAVMAVGSALGVRRGKARVASFAHSAEIICGTGLGTVSSTYDHEGTGVVSSPGGPGIAEVKAVRTPREARVVTASFEPWEKKPFPSSPGARKRADDLGADALRRATSPLSFKSILEAGEGFSRGLGLETPQMRRLIELAKGAGALAAGQNMVGNAIHAVVLEGHLERVLSSLRASSPQARIDVFSIGGAPAKLL